MKRPLAIVDLDDTLNDATETAVDALLARGLIERPVVQRSQDSLECFGIGWQEYQRILVEDRCLERANPLPGVQSALDGLREECELWIVTSRAWHPNSERVTQAWMSKHHCAYDKLLVVPYPQSKALFVADQRSRIACAVDDLPRHVEAIMRLSNCRGFVIDRPWNRHTQFVAARVRHIAEAEDDMRLATMASFQLDVRADAMEKEQELWPSM